ACSERRASARAPIAPAAFPQTDPRPTRCGRTGTARSLRTEGGKTEGGNMNTSILVVYASTHGPTRQVAETVAKRLEAHGLRVELSPAADVRDITEYDAVVVGAALYTGRMVADARRFLRRNHAQLAERPFAVFAMGPLTTSDHDVAGATK